MQARLEFIVFMSKRIHFLLGNKLISVFNCASAAVHRNILTAFPRELIRVLCRIGIGITPEWSSGMNQNWKQIWNDNWNQNRPGLDLELHQNQNQHLITIGIRISSEWQSQFIQK